MKLKEIAHSRTGDKGDISKTNESLICLPHKLVVEITDDEIISNNDDLDAIVK